MQIRCASIGPSCLPKTLKDPIGEKVSVIATTTHSESDDFSTL